MEKSMKVQIAEDVLSMLHLPGLLDVQRNNAYIWPKGEGFTGEESKYEKCTVCALGAMLLSDVQRDGDFSWFLNIESPIGVPSQWETRHRLQKYFSRDELKGIEDAFEHGASYFNFYRNPGRRLAAIMNNIIRNDGFRWADESYRIESYSEEERAFWQAY